MNDQLQVVFSFHVRGEKSPSQKHPIKEIPSIADHFATTTLENLKRGGYVSIFSTDGIPGHRFTIDSETLKALKVVSQKEESIFVLKDWFLTLGKKLSQKEAIAELDTYFGNKSEEECS